jgi:hypothetical protein
MNGLPVAVEATFTTSTDTIAVSVENTVVNPKSVVQNLSGLGFVLSSGETYGSITSSAGLARTVNKGGSYSDGSTVATGWDLENSFTFPLGTGLRLYLLGAPSKIAPAHTIIGDPDTLGFYSNANKSIAGSGTHNQFLYGPVTFALNVPGVTANTTITAAQFSFNTSQGDYINVPVPGSLFLLGAGLLGLAVWRRRDWSLP